MVTNFENQSIFGETVDKSIVSRFFDSRCINKNNNNNYNKKDKGVIRSG